MVMPSRPLSPHLQIYKLPLAPLLSIAHRLTGVFLTLGTVVLAYWLIALASGPDAFAKATTALASWGGKIALIAWSFALFFHLFNGVRHLFWDAGYGFDLKTVDNSGVAVLLATALATITTWLLASGL
ncbi:MAG: succinate dehydrogenase, cytochrome b556 subunit [Gammaproteobacteria bacterium]